jgi:addiction module HigA family antidote
MNSLANDTKRESCPTHPGAMLKEKFMPEYELTATSLADALGISRKSVSDLLNERRALTPVMALRLARLFGNGPEFWLNAQQAVDLWHTEQKYRDKLDQIQQIHVKKGASKT